MNASLALPANRTTARSMIIAVMAMSTAFPLLAQDSAVQERLAAVKQAMAANAQKLHQYQWIETTQVTLNGEQKPATQNRKQAEMKQYMGEVKSVLALYLPPDPQKMEQAKQAGNLSVNPVPGLVNLIFKNYVQPGDQLTLTFDPLQERSAP